jgi:hypothetical protein
VCGIKNDFLHVVLPFSMSVRSSRTAKITNKAMAATIGMIIAERSAPFIFFGPDP